MSFSLIVKEFKLLSVLYLNFSNALAFLNGVHWAWKWEIKISDFILKSGTSLSSARLGGMAGISLLFINLPMMNLCVIGAILGLSKLDNYRWCLKKQDPS